MKFCKDCIFYVPYRGFLRHIHRYGKCRHPAALQEDPEYMVSGIVSTYASHFRAVIGKCGPTAEFWENNGG